MTGAGPAGPAAGGAGRFAPTPTGRLHLGNARTALLAWRWARREGLRNVLRVEDLDPRAIPKGCLEGQYADLDWLGLIYDEEPRRGGPCGPYRQSERSAFYLEGLRALDRLGLVYPCWCSRQEVLRAALAPHADDEGPVYAGTCRPGEPAPLGDDALAVGCLPERNGRAPALRFDVARAMTRLGVDTVTFDDVLAGPQRFDVLGDFVVRRGDGVFAYQLACALDDAAMGCTQVLRGMDLIASTARQLLILGVSGLKPPTYAHVGLALAPDGRRLAKRDAATALEEMRASGAPASAVVRALARSAGLPDTADLDALAAAFDVRKVPAGAVVVEAPA
jgi:glutamyl-tRNA synthetase